MTEHTSSSTLAILARTIADRRSATADASYDASYTKSLLEKGATHCARKFGEEAIEFVLASAGEGDDAVVSEAADVLFHLLVTLDARDVSIADVEAELTRRMGVSGHAEKAARLPKAVD